RERLRARLTRRGLTPTAAFLTQALTEGTTTAAGLLRVGAVPPRVAALAECAIAALFPARVKGALLILGITLAAAVGYALVALDEPGAKQAEDSDNILHPALPRPPQPRRTAH